MISENFDELRITIDLWKPAEPRLNLGLPQITTAQYFWTVWPRQGRVTMVRAGSWKTNDPLTASWVYTILILYKSQSPLCIFTTSDPTIGLRDSFGWYQGVWQINKALNYFRINF